MRKVIFICAAVSLPFAARAQNFTLTSPEAITVGTAAPQIYVGKADCATEILTFHWDMTAESEPTTGQVINIVHAHSTSACGSTSSPTGVGETLATAQSQTSTGDDSVSAQAMILDTDGGLAGGCDNTTTSSASPYTTYYCVQLASNTTTTTGVLYQDVQINYATAPPTPPTAIDVEPGDSHLKLGWTKGASGEAIESYDVHVLAPGDVLDLTKKAATTTSTNADVTTTDTGAALQDDVTYQVQLVANDLYGNVSATSAPASGMPVHILDFYQLYRQDGGDAKGGGGCGSTGSFTWIVLLGLAGAFIARRRKRARNASALIALFALLAPAAHAEGYERPKRFLLIALKVDRYDPKVDSEAGLTGTPYKDIFGTRAPLRYQLEADWEAWHPFGTILLGITAGYWQNIGKGLIAATGATSQDTALLDVLPLGVVATYRFDKLSDLWVRWPVIPYAQIGYMRALWASFGGTGSVSKSSNGGRGSGWTNGYSTALGVAMALDAIDPDLSREAYADTGVQRSSVFAEYGWTRLDNFKKPGELILSDRAWRFGVSIEF